jgi:hypothetical protein
MSPLHVLLVEGPDDEHVVGHLLKFHGLLDSIKIKAKGGLPKLMSEFPVELRASDLKTIAVVIDADLSLPGRWNEIRALLVTTGYGAVPATPDLHGTIVTAENKPSVGIWVMPDNRVSGMLEDFAQMLMPDDDTLLPRAHQAVDQIPQPERLFNEQSHSKAVIHTWLAWQEEPGKPMGGAINRRYLRADSPVGLAFVEWMKRLLAV